MRIQASMAQPDYLVWLTEQGQAWEWGRSAGAPLIRPDPGHRYGLIALRRALDSARLSGARGDVPRAAHGTVRFGTAA